MLLLFINLYTAMFTGTWYPLTWLEVISINKSLFNKLGELVTSVFGDNNMLDFGEVMFKNNMIDSFPTLLATILATITSIGIVVMAAKGVKKAFGIFFMGLRR